MNVGIIGLGLMGTTSD